MIRGNSIRAKVASDNRFEHSDFDAVMDRFLLWIDAVGGYLVCLNSELLIGRAGPDSKVDIPIAADIENEHLKIVRRRNQYLIDPICECRINSEKVSQMLPLLHNDLIEFGNTRLRFNQPTRKNGTARLNFEGPHRTTPFTDSILLMAESCILGPGDSQHINCRDWKKDFVLCRRDEKLFCRSTQHFEIDGNQCDGLGILKENSKILGEDFSLSVEQI